MQIYDELVWRGLIKDESSPELKDLLNKGGMTFYIGTDPTGDSMHIGHFSSFLISKRLKDAGHNPILLIVPCHRVVGADGSLTGYAGGRARKHWLLELEQTEKRPAPRSDASVYGDTIL